MKEIVRQNSFSRSITNDAKAGAYYTDISHLKSLRSLLEFPEEEVCCLEPSIGDASAVTALTEGANVKVFGVEINTETARAVRESGKTECTLNADFLNGVRITNSVFSLCFANPPYGEDVAAKTRYEQLFLERIHVYLAAGGVLVYVIPEYVLKDDRFRKSMHSRFEFLDAYRFRKPEYDRFKQCAVILKKKEHPGFTEAEKDSVSEKLEALSELPVEFTGKKICVPASSHTDVRLFALLRFNPEEALPLLKDVPLNGKLSMLGTEPFTGDTIKSPIIPLSNDMYYLLAISGAGQGKAGTKETGDLHLQRGCVKRVTSQTVQEGRIIEREYSAITLSIVEQSGKITRMT